MRYTTGTSTTLGAGGAVGAAVNVVEDKGGAKASFENSRIDFAEGYEDGIGGIMLNITTRDEFEATYGKGSKTEPVTMETVEAECEKVTYDWGYAIMGKARKSWVVLELYFTSERFRGPRGTGVGDKESFIVGKFRDMGQLESPSGNRGLYADGNDVGKIFAQDDGGKIIRYRGRTADSHIWQLEYILDKGGSCRAIRWTFEN